MRQVDEAAPYGAVLPASACVPSPPRFTFGNFPSTVAAGYYRATQLHGMGVYSGENLRWSDCFVIEGSGDFLVGTQVNLPSHNVAELDPDRRAAILSAPTERLTGAAAIILPSSRAYRIYGHWLTDMLPKLAVLEAAGHDWRSLWYPIPDATPKFGVDLMLLFGIPQSRIVRVASGRAITADALLMPTSMHNGVRYSPLLRDMTVSLRQELGRSDGAVPAHRGQARIFLARKDRKRLVTNRARIEAMARSAGFEVVYPETMTLAEQVALFSSAREIVGEYGSAFHTAMFSPAATVVCGLRGGQFHPAFIQSGIGEVLDQPTGYVFGEPQGDPARYDYMVPEDVFSDCLKIVFDRHAGLAGTTEAVQRQVAASPAADATGETAERPPDPLEDFATSAPLPHGVPVVFLMGHIQNRGDTQAGPDGWLGRPGSVLAIEGLQISFGRSVPSGVSYQVLLADERLSEPVQAGLYCGSRGRGVPLLGFRLLADAVPDAAYSMRAEAHFRDGSRCEPAGPGVILRSPTLSPLTALRVTATPN